MHEAGALDRPPVVQRLLKGIEDKPGMGGPGDAPADDPPREGVDDEGDVDEALLDRDVGEVRHPFGRGARNCRFTRSAGHGAPLSGTVVLVSFPRTTPRKPICRISRVTVQRATGVPERPS